MIAEIMAANAAQYKDQAGPYYQESYATFYPPNYKVHDPANIARAKEYLVQALATFPFLKDLPMSKASYYRSNDSLSLDFTNNLGQIYKSIWIIVFWDYEGHVYRATIKTQVNSPAANKALKGPLSYTLPKPLNDADFQSIINWFRDPATLDPYETVEEIIP